MTSDQIGQDIRYTASNGTYQNPDIYRKNPYILPTKIPTSYLPQSRHYITDTA